ncbi:outer membrane beta-barrel protein [Maridesulfovibrio frigidus]|uniref:outer membrane beta-barrel protein n=1 Tax=Maridesulfovibrio frigidus TaxID=340956 RepID=UPI0004E171C3|nr:outer membrane beta-barrel protein [Maridesulfovibrio frigidus]
MKILIVFIILMTIPFSAFAWKGKVVAVDSATSLIILKDGTDPIKVHISQIKQSSHVDAAKAQLETSNIALMKDVTVKTVKNISKNEIEANVILDGANLNEKLVAAGVAFKVSEPDNPAPVESQPLDQKSAEETTINPSMDSTPNEQSASEEVADANKPDAQEIISELSEPKPQLTEERAPQQIFDAPPPRQSYKAPAVRYVQVQHQPQQLGFWPSRPAPVATLPYAATPESEAQYDTTSASTAAPFAIAGEEASSMKQAGDIAREEQELAVRVSKRSPIKKNKGFFTSKKRSETFVGASLGTQYTTKQKSDVPYSSFGPGGGLGVRHFFPSGLGLGGDLLISGTSGASGTIAASSNATNGTSYDYKSKSFMTYSFTGSLLYRFYADSSFSPYIAAHGGYTFFDFPATEFGLSDGAPVAGGGLGFLYEFDSGFTIGSDVRYLKTFGTKAHDPDGFLNTTINFGYTFN